MENTLHMMTLIRLNAFLVLDVGIEVGSTAFRNKTLAPMGCAGKANDIRIIA